MADQEGEPSAASIQFFQETGGELPPDIERAQLSSWIARVCQLEGGRLAALNYIFCGDEYLLEINRQYLQHDYYTDIITFPAEAAPVVGGDIFISTDRVRENAKIYGSTYLQELRRVVIHGVLHLCGQGDKSESEAKEMRAKEDAALQLVDW